WKRYAGTLNTPSVRSDATMARRCMPSWTGTRTLPSLTSSTSAWSRHINSPRISSSATTHSKILWGGACLAGLRWRRSLKLQVGQGDDSGRKLRPERLLADVHPPLQFSTMELAAATKFGEVHLPSASRLDQEAARLISANATMLNS